MKSIFTLVQQLDVHREPFLAGFQRVDCVSRSNEAAKKVIGARCCRPLTLSVNDGRIA
jgi:hypothetical protein